MKLTVSLFLFLPKFSFELTVRIWGGMGTVKLTTFCEQEQEEYSHKLAASINDKCINIRFNE